MRGRSRTSSRAERRGSSSGRRALADPAFAGRARRRARRRTGSPSPSTSAMGEPSVMAGPRTRPGSTPSSAIGRLADAGVETFEVTAIDRDGLLEGPDLELYERLVALDRGAIIASGGITTVADCGGRDAAVAARSSVEPSTKARARRVGDADDRQSQTASAVE